MSAGDNVDVVVDFTADIAEVSHRLHGRQFSTIICCSVLEHVDDVHKAAANIATILAPGGTLFVSVPFTWRHHGYPSDYWRFTFGGARELFPTLDWRHERCTVSTTVDGDEAPLVADEPNDFVVFKLHETGPGLMARALRKAQLALLPARVRRHPYVLLPTMINLVAVKPTDR
jgi:SAM-dependent methyltransferase